MKTPEYVYIIILNGEISGAYRSIVAANNALTQKREENPLAACYIEMEELL